jgi:hypothetical protein
MNAIRYVEKEAVLYDNTSLSCLGQAIYLSSFERKKLRLLISRSNIARIVGEKGYYNINSWHE